MRTQLCKQAEGPDRQAVNGHTTASGGCAEGIPYHIPCVSHHIFFDRKRGRLFLSALEEFRPHRAGTDGRDENALFPKLLSQRPGKAEHIGLSRRVNRETGLGKEGGAAGKLDDPAPSSHKGEADAGHVGQRPAV